MSDGVEMERVGGWFDRGACVGFRLEHGNELWSKTFFPGRGESARPAKEICAGCPVAQQCLSYALRNMIKFGIWGGKSEQERRVMRKAMADELRPYKYFNVKRASCGTPSGYARHRRRGEDACVECRRAYGQAALRRKQDRLARQRQQGAA